MLPTIGRLCVGSVGTGMASTSWRRKRRGQDAGLLTWVAEKCYLLDTDEDFQRYHARRIRERNDGSTD